LAALGALLGGCAATPEVGLTGIEIPPLIVAIIERSVAAARRFLPPVRQRLPKRRSATELTPLERVDERLHKHLILA
ncbi:MAG: hypothetical protein AAGL66_12935, partial [Pseudomonadota bacterium]